MDKKRVLLIAILTLAFVAGILFWGIPLYFEGRYFEGVSLSAAALIVAFFGFKMLYAVLKNVNKGYPLEDERLMRIKTRAAAYAFYIGIYWILAIMWFEDVIVKYLPNFDISSAAGAAIMGQAVIFGLAYWILSSKGDVKN